MGASLLHYRPWRGRFQSPFRTIWPITRISLWMIFRRKLFWVLYALALLIFLMFFFGQYMLSWAESQTAETTVSVGVIRTDPQRFIELFRNFLKLDGQPEMYRNFFWWQGYMVMTVLALAGSILVGNDFHFGSLPFYLSKPLGRWHYLLGKCCAVAVFVNLMTTLPALVLFFQFGLLDSWDYFVRDGYVLARPTIAGMEFDIRLLNPILFGILGYGLVLTVCLSLVLVATASWLKRTVPMIMVWTTLFLFCRLLATTLVDRLQYHPRWRLFDLWNDTYVVGSAMLELRPNSFRSDRQPQTMEAALVLSGVCLLCLMYLNRRIRAVEIVK
jgi:ABC-2 type transport system permease protein